MDHSIRQIKRADFDIRKIVQITPVIPSSSALLAEMARWTRESHHMYGVTLGDRTLGDRVRDAIARKFRTADDKPRVRFVTSPIDAFTPRQGGEWICSMARPSYWDHERFDSWSAGVLWCRGENSRRFSGH